MKINQTNIFLETLFSKVDNTDLIELRPINPKGVKQHFIFRSNTELLIEKIEEYEKNYNVFIGIQPRTNKSGKDSSVKKVICLWADIDAKDFKGGKNEALKQINKFSLNPTILIDSGNGYHAYWLLEKPFIINNKNDRKKIKKISKLLHKTLKADSTHNLSRILRVPGTRNIKDKDNLIYCSIEHIQYNYYSLNEIEKAIPKTIKNNYEQKEAINIQLRGETSYNNLKELEKIMGTEFIERAKKIPARLEGDRSGNDFWLAREMYEADLSDVDVIYAFKLFSEKNWEGGSKFKERGLKYLTKYTLPSAKQDSEDFNEILINLEQDQENYLDIAIKKIANMKNREDSIQKVAKLTAIDYIDIEQRVNKIVAQKNIKRYFIKDDKNKLKFNANKAGNNFLKKYYILNTAGELRVYNNGYYKPNQNNLVQKIIVQEMGSLWKQRYQNELMEWLKIMTKENLKNLPGNENYLNVKNGMLNLNTMELEPHSPNFKSLHQIDVEFNTDSYVKRVDTFMEEVFPKNTIDLLWEHIGYAMMNVNKYKKFLILYGSGNNGKSVFIDMVNKILGEENVSHESLHNLAEDKYATASLLGKLANTNADLDDKAVKYTGVLKMLTGGDPIRAEKKFVDSFSFYNKAHLIFSCNKLPTLYDYNKAFFDRVHIVHCGNVFNKENKDVNLLDKLTTESAKSHILNKAIEGIKRLKKNNGFTENRHTKKQLRKYKFSNDSVAQFIKEELVETDNSKIYETKDIVYGEYKSWCKENGKRAVSKYKFTSRAKAEPYTLRDDVKYLHGKTTAIWKGVKLQ